MGNVNAAAPPINGPFLNTEQAAAYVGLAPQTLINMRSKGKGPRCLYLGRRVVYAPQDLDEYVAKENGRTFGKVA